MTLLLTGAGPGFGTVIVPDGILDGLSPTGAWSMGRKIVSAYGGSFYSTTSGNVSSLHDQSGNGRDLAPSTETTRPQPTTAGPSGRACAQFDGSNDFLNSGAVAISSFISVSAGYVIASVIVDDITTNASNPWENDKIWTAGGATTANVGFVFKSAPTGHAYNWDGNADITTHTSFPLDTVVVCEWKHTGGQLYGRVNAGTWGQVASGNTTTLSSPLRIAHGDSVFTELKLFEFATFNAALTEEQENAVCSNFMAYIGA